MAQASYANQDGEKKEADLVKTNTSDTITPPLNSILTAPPLDNPDSNSKISRRRLTVADILSLQRTIGNRAVSRLISKNRQQLVRVSAVTGQIARAFFEVGTVRVNVDYGGLGSVLPANYQNAIESRFQSWTGAANANAIHTDLTALNESQLRWVLYGLDLLVDNTTAAHSRLDRTQAVRDLITHAPTATVSVPAGSAFNSQFEREVLRVSGWFEVALSATMATPGASTLTALDDLYNPPSTAPGASLNVAQLNTLLRPALRTRLQNNDPANWSAVGTEPLANLQTIADQVQAVAREFFAPYADTPKDNRYATNWNYSTNLHDITAQTPDQAGRINYLTNRATIVGRDSTNGPSIFSRVNFDSTRPADRVALAALVQAMESDTTLQALVDRLIRHTGVNRPATGFVGISTEYDAGRFTARTNRWMNIDTLTHELVHALVHPKFRASANTVDFDQIIKEGFTEVLGAQLHEHIRRRAMTDVAFRNQMELGLPPVTPWPTPAAATIGYGDAGTSAEEIRRRVGDNRFRAAYFLGALHLVGL